MKKILIFSGAGLSAESGVQTFRDSNGLWNGFDPMVVANYRTFNKNKDLVRDFYNARRAQLETVKPNAVHEGIAALQKQYGAENVEVFTQNVDNLLEAAGVEGVCHVHGFLTDMMCLEDACGKVWDIGYKQMTAEDTCPECGSKHIKPGVVFFGEQAPQYERLYKTFHDSRLDLIIVIGTSGEVIPMERITGNRRSTRKSFTVLNNRDYDKFGQVNLKLFDTVLIEPATRAWPRIREIADAFMTGIKNVE